MPSLIPLACCLRTDVPPFIPNFHFSPSTPNLLSSNSLSHGREQQNHPRSVVDRLSCKSQAGSSSWLSRRRALNQVSFKIEQNLLSTHSESRKGVGESNGDFFHAYTRWTEEKREVRGWKKKIFHLLILLLMLFVALVLLCKRRQEHVECEEILINSITSSVGRAEKNKS